jgi:glucuronoarabinoxylan endo-1,4-beta-xylanase
VLFRDLGLDILRIRNNYETEPKSMEETIEVAKAARAVRDGNLKILMTSWGPPAYLKSNNNLIGGTLKKKDGKFMYDEFAQWWCKSVMEYSKAGVNIDYISIQNELDYEAPWISCRFAPTETSDSTLPGFDKALEIVRDKLIVEMKGDTPKLLAPESSGLGNSKEYIENLDNLSHVYGYAHHLYDCSGCGSAPDRFIPRMESYHNLAMKYGNKPIFQTEFEDEPGTWADAINTALVIHNSLTVENVSAYLYWDLFWETGTALVSMDNDTSYTIKPTYYTFKQYSAFIDADWQRVEASTDNTGIRLSAYISPDDKKVTVVLINTTDTTNVSLNLFIKNFPFSKCEIYRSSAKENCLCIGTFSGKAPLKVPANSVTTLVMTSGKN